MMIKKALLYSMLGSLGLAIGLQGCGQSEEPNQTNPNGTISEASKSEEGLFLVIKQTAKDPDAFIIVEKHPSSTGTRAILKDMEGNERILTEEELKKLAEAEAAKVEDGTSNLTQTPAASSPGLSLGETILAGAAGALIGGMIANKLAGNSNYQQHQYQQQTQTSAYQQTQRDFNRNTSGNTSAPKTGIFSDNKNNPNTGGNTSAPKTGIFSNNKNNGSSSGFSFENIRKKKRF
ncbi:MAG: hypothetical protein ABFS56_08100 [Pseudomonadota bacterium]